MTTHGPGRPTIEVGLLLCLAAVLAGCTFLAPFGITTPPTDAPRATAASPTRAPAITGAEPSVATTSERPHSPSPALERSLGFVAIGDFPPDVVAALAAFYWKKYGIHVEILLASPLDQSALDPERNQFVAEDLVAALARSYSQPESEQGRVIIGLVAEDVYIRDRPDWHWAFGVRGDNGYAVVSTARMGGLADPIAPIVMSRLRKMVTRDIGVLYYGLPLNHDRSSVLYFDILGLDDLDRMDEEECGLDCPVISSTSGGPVLASN